MGREKRVRNIAEMARKIQEYRALKNRPTESQQYAMDYENLTRTFSGKRMPLLAWEDINNEKQLFSLLAGLRSFGIGRMVTKKSWLEDFDEPCYWTITTVKVDYTAEIKELPKDIRDKIVDLRKAGMGYTSGHQPCPQGPLTGQEFSNQNRATRKPKPDPVEKSKEEKE